MLMATWRNACPPVRFDDPVYHVLPKHNFVLHPFSGQPKKYREPRRLPGCEVRESGIPRAGNGLWTAERVRKGQTIIFGFVKPGPRSDNTFRGAHPQCHTSRVLHTPPETKPWSCLWVAAFRSQPWTRATGAVPRIQANPRIKEKPTYK